MLLLVVFLGFQVQINAMLLKGEEYTNSKVYKATRSAAIKSFDKMGIKYKVDSDGDMIYELDNRKGYKVYLIFSELKSSKKIWNIKLVCQFGTKLSRYDELIDYANTWNSTKKYPKVSMKDKDSLRLDLNYPVEYGFNPDEFEDNIVSIFERAVKTIADDTKAMRR